MSGKRAKWLRSQFEKLYGRPVRKARYQRLALAQPIEQRDWRGRLVRAVTVRVVRLKADPVGSEWRQFKRKYWRELRRDA
jgi:hypothetical protein